jgi:hypothetical protein
MNLVPFIRKRHTERQANVAASAHNRDGFFGL